MSEAGQFPLRQLMAPDACLSHVFQAFLNMVHIILAHPRIVHGPAAILNILHERFAVAGPGSAQAVYGIHHRIKTGTGTQPGGRGQKDTHAIPGAAGRRAYAGQSCSGYQYVEPGVGV